MTGPRIRRYFHRRGQPEAGPVTLTHRRIYIMPDRNGLLCALVLLVMLIGSLNFQLSLGFALTFLLAGVFLVSILHTYRNLLGLTISAGRSEPAFAGGMARYTLLLESPAGGRYAIHLTPAGGDAPPVVTDVAAAGVTPVTLAVPARRRGWQPLGRVRLGTRFPLGVVVAWSELELAFPCLVYPRPEAGHPPLPERRNGHNGGGHGGGGGDDFNGLRDYHRGDSLRQVHWKAAAREGKLLLKQFSGSARRELWLPWEATAGIPEARLSRLCRWVLEAEAAGLHYGLRLPGATIPPGHGPQQRHACLSALALLGQEEPPHGR